MGALHSLRGNFFPSRIPISQSTLPPTPSSGFRVFFFLKLLPPRRAGMRPPVSRRTPRPAKDPEIPPIPFTSLGREEEGEAGKTEFFPDPERSALGLEPGGGLKKSTRTKDLPFPARRSAPQSLSLGFQRSDRRGSPRLLPRLTCQPPGLKQAAAAAAALYPPTAPPRLKPSRLRPAAFPTCSCLQAERSRQPPIRSPGRLSRALALPPPPPLHHLSQGQLL